jgi:hypothetical protein
MTVGSEIILKFSSNWDLVSQVPAMTSSSHSMTYGGVSNIVRNLRILQGGHNGNFLVNPNERILSYTKQILITMGSEISAGNTISFGLSIKNPTSTTISNSDFIMEFWINNILESKA